MRISGTVGEVREEGWNSSHLHSSLSLSPLDFLLAPPSSVFTPHPLPLCSSPLTQWAPGGVDSRSTLHQPGSQTGQLPPPAPPPHLTALLRNTLTCCLTPPLPPPSLSLTLLPSVHHCLLSRVLVWLVDPSLPTVWLIRFVLQRFLATQQP